MRWIGHIVGAAAFAFGGGDQEVVASNGEGAGVPGGRDKTEGLCAYVSIVNLEDSDSVQCSSCHEKTRPIR